MKIEATEKIMHGRDVFEAGDIRTVPNEIGEYFCAMGWAKDTEGKVKTGERNTTDVRVTPDNVVKAMAAGEVK